MVADGEGARAQALLLRRFRGSDTATTEGHRIPGATRRANVTNITRRIEFRRLDS